MCDCINKTFKQGDLAKKYHTRLVVTMPLDPGVCSKVVLATETTFDAPKRTKGVTLIATYCPFCGVKYEDNLTALEGK